ncbi:uncharacterized protein MONBRDRAFT_27653 [Monosiga brevicollis MX1]|uniref:Uncharacterized protein n=1 Tax=Monosiga brevicollis TaxID=81824 RepID=A9V5X7_MONBE|nr:uncharacterized protein MONBRDRAFT_27653 [Monosiga brevicollis MX1]EDQ87125.1 predicted protein [Monosiga brevicollis MX1]|eukprot:XP_001748068.1 hypothetical protein [Monosiga brevicollis MX1]
MIGSKSCANRAALLGALPLAIATIALTCPWASATSNYSVIRHLNGPGETQYVPVSDAFSTIDLSTLAAPLGEQTGRVAKETWDVVHLSGGPSGMAENSIVSLGLGEMSAVVDASAVPAVSANNTQSQLHTVQVQMLTPILWPSITEIRVLLRGLDRNGRQLTGGGVTAYARVVKPSDVAGEAALVQGCQLAPGTGTCVVSLEVPAAWYSEPSYVAAGSLLGTRVVPVFGLTTASGTVSSSFGRLTLRPEGSAVVSARSATAAGSLHVTLPYSSVEDASGAARVLLSTRVSAAGLDSLTMSVSFEHQAFVVSGFEPLAPVDPTALASVAASTGMVVLTQLGVSGPRTEIVELGWLLLDVNTTVQAQLDVLETMNVSVAATVIGMTDLAGNALGVDVSVVQDAYGLQSAGSSTGTGTMVMGSGRAVLAAFAVLEDDAVSSFSGLTGVPDQFNVSVYYARSGWTRDIVLYGSGEVAGHAGVDLSCSGSANVENGYGHLSASCLELIVNGSHSTGTAASSLALTVRAVRRDGSATTESSQNKECVVSASIFVVGESEVVAEKSTLRRVTDLLPASVGDEAACQDYQYEWCRVRVTATLQAVTGSGGVLTSAPVDVTAIVGARLRSNDTSIATMRRFGPSVGTGMSANLVFVQGIAPGAFVLELGQDTSISSSVLASSETLLCSDLGRVNVLGLEAIYVTGLEARLALPVRMGPEANTSIVLTIEREELYRVGEAPGAVLVSALLDDETRLPLTLGGSAFGWRSPQDGELVMQSIAPATVAVLDNGYGVEVVAGALADHGGLLEVVWRSGNISNGAEHCDASGTAGKVLGRGLVQVAVNVFAPQQLNGIDSGAVPISGLYSPHIGSRLDAQDIEFPSSFLNASMATDGSSLVRPVGYVVGSVSDYRRELELGEGTVTLGLGEMSAVVDASAVPAVSANNTQSQLHTVQVQMLTPILWPSITEIRVLLRGLDRNGRQLTGGGVTAYARVVKPSDVAGEAALVQGCQLAPGTGTCVVSLEVPAAWYSEPSYVAAGSLLGTRVVPVFGLTTASGTLGVSGPRTEIVELGWLLLDVNTTVQAQLDVLETMNVSVAATVIGMTDLAGNALGVDVSVVQDAYGLQSAVLYGSGEVAGHAGVDLSCSGSANVENGYGHLSASCLELIVNGSHSTGTAASSLALTVRAVRRDGSATTESSQNKECVVSASIFVVGESEVVAEKSTLRRVTDLLPASVGDEAACQDYQYEWCRVRVTATLQAVTGSGGVLTSAPVDVTAIVGARLRSNDTSIATMRRFGPSVGTGMSANLVFVQGIAPGAFVLELGQDTSISSSVLASSETLLCSDLGRVNVLGLEAIYVTGLEARLALPVRMGPEANTSIVLTIEREELYRVGEAPGAVLVSALLDDETRLPLTLGGSAFGWRSPQDGELVMQSIAPATVAVLDNGYGVEVVAGALADHGGLLEVVWRSGNISNGAEHCDASGTAGKVLGRGLVQVAVDPAPLHGILPFPLVTTSGLLVDSTLYINSTSLESPVEFKSTVRADPFSRSMSFDIPSISSQSYSISQPPRIAAVVATHAHILKVDVTPDSLDTSVVLSVERESQRQMPSDIELQASLKLSDDVDAAVLPRHVNGSCTASAATGACIVQLQLPSSWLLNRIDINGTGLQDGGSAQLYASIGEQPTIRSNGTTVLLRALGPAATVASPALEAGGLLAELPMRQLLPEETFDVPVFGMWSRSLQAFSFSAAVDEGLVIDGFTGSSGWTGEVLALDSRNVTGTFIRSGTGSSAGLQLLGQLHLVVRTETELGLGFAEEREVGVTLMTLFLSDVNGQEVINDMAGAELATRYGRVEAGGHGLGHVVVVSGERVVGLVSYLPDSVELINTAILTGNVEERELAHLIVRRKDLQRFVGFSQEDSALSLSCNGSGDGLPAAPFGVSVDCHSIFMNSSHSNAGIGIVDVSLTQVGVAENLRSSIKAAVWAPELPVEVLVDRAELHPVAEWIDPSITNIADCNKFQYQTGTVEVRARFSLGNGDSERVVVTDLLAASLYVNETGVAKMRRLVGAPMVQGVAEGSVVVEARRASDGALLGHSDTIIVGPHDVSPIVVLGLDAILVHDVDVSLRAGEGANGTDLVDVTLRRDSLSEEGIVDANVLVSAVFDDGTRMPLSVEPAVLQSSDGNVSVHSLAPASLSVDATQTIAVVRDAVNSEGGLLEAVWLSAASAACPSRLIGRGDIEVRVAVPPAESVMIDSSATVIASGDDPASVAGIAVEAQLRVALIYPGQRQVDATNDNRTVVELMGDNHLVSLSQVDGGAFVILARPDAAGQSGTVMVRIGFVHEPISTTFNLSVVSGSDVEMSVHPYPSYSGSRDVQADTLAPYSGSQPLQYQQAIVSANLILSSGAKLDISMAASSDFVLTPAGAAVSASLPLLMRSSGQYVVGTNLSSALTTDAMVTLFATYGASGRRQVNSSVGMPLTFTSAPVFVSSFSGFRLDSGNTLRGVVDEASSRLRASCTLSDGRQLSDMFPGSSGVLIPGLVEFTSSRSDVLDVDATTGRVTLRGNAGNEIELRIIARSNSSVSASVSVAGNLDADVGDVDLGADAGLPVPASQSVGTSFTLGVYVNTGGASAGAYAFEVLFDPEALAATEAVASVDGIFSARFDENRVVFGGTVTAGAVQGTRVQVASLTFEVVGSGTTTVSGVVTTLSQSSVDAADIGLETPRSFVAGRIEIQLGSDRRRRAGNAMQSATLATMRQRRAGTVATGYERVGDVNGDGILSVRDTQFLLQYYNNRFSNFVGAQGAQILAALSGNNYSQGELDADQNGEINPRDAIYVNQVVFGLWRFVRGTHVDEVAATTACELVISLHVVGAGGMAASYDTTRIYVDFEGGESLRGNETVGRMLAASAGLESVGRFWTANKSASAELTGVVFEAMPGNASGESGGDAGLWQVRVPTSLVATGVGLSIIQVTLETSEPRFLVGAERSPYANGAELVVTVDRPSLPTSANAREVVSSGVVAGYNPLLRFNNTMDTITCKLEAGICAIGPCAAARAIAGQCSLAEKSECLLLNTTYYPSIVGAFGVRSSVLPMPESAAFVETLLSPAWQNASTQDLGAVVESTTVSFLSSGLSLALGEQNVLLQLDGSASAAVRTLTKAMPAASKVSVASLTMQEACPEDVSVTAVVQGRAARGSVIFGGSRELRASLKLSDDVDAAVLPRHVNGSCTASAATGACIVQLQLPSSWLLNRIDINGTGLQDGGSAQLYASIGEQPTIRSNGTTVLLRALGPAATVASPALEAGGLLAELPMRQLLPEETFDVPVFGMWSRSLQAFSFSAAVDEGLVIDGFTGSSGWTGEVLALDSRNVTGTFIRSGTGSSAGLQLLGQLHLVVRTETELGLGFAEEREVGVTLMTLFLSDVNGQEVINDMAGAELATRYGRVEAGGHGLGHVVVVSGERVVGLVSYLPDSVELINTAILTGNVEERELAHLIVRRKDLQRFVGFSQEDSALSLSCNGSGDGLPAAPFGVSVDCHSIFMNSSHSNAGIGIVDVSLTQVGVAENLRSSIKAAVWAPELPVEVLVDRAELHPVAEWIDPSITNIADCNKFQYQTGTVEVRARFSLGNGDSERVVVTDLLAASLYVNETGVAKMRRLVGAPMVQGVAEGSVVVEARRASDGALLGHSDTIIVGPHDVSPIVVLGLDAILVHDVDVSLRAGEGANGTDLVDVTLRRDSLSEEGIVDANVLVSAVFDDGTRMPLSVEPAVLQSSDGNVSVHSLAPASLSVDATQTIAVVRDAVNSEGGLLEAVWLSAASAACPSRLIGRGDIEVRVAVPPAESVMIDSSATVIASGDDPASVAGIAVEAQLRVALIYPGQRQVDATNDNRTVVELMGDNHLVSLSQVDGGAFVILARPDAAGQSGTVMVRIGFVHEPISTTFNLSVVSGSDVEMSVHPYPSYSGSRDVQADTLAPYSGSQPLQYQQAIVSANLILSSGAKLDISMAASSDFVLTPAGAAVSASLPLLMRSSGQYVVGTNLSSALTTDAMVTLFATYGASGRRQVNSSVGMPLTFTSAPVFVSSFSGFRLDSGNTLRGVVDEASSRLRASCTLSDGRQLSDMFPGSSGVLIPGLVEFTSSRSDVLDVDATTGRVTLRGNAGNEIELRIIARSNSSVSASVSVAGNLDADVGDVDLGADAGLPVPASQSVGTSFTLGVYVNTGGASAGAYAFEVLFDPEALAATEAVASVDGIFSARFDENRVVFGGTVTAGAVQGTRVQVASLTFEVVGSGTTTVSGVVTTLSQSSVDAADIGLETPRSFVAGRIEIQLGSDRRRRAGNAMQSATLATMRQRRAGTVATGYERVGDVNGDGILSVRDTQFLLQYYNNRFSNFVGAQGAQILAALSGNNYSQGELDADQNGEINPRDAIYVNQVVFGLWRFVRGTHVDEVAATTACELVISLHVVGAGGMAASYDTTRIYVDFEGGESLRGNETVGRMLAASAGLESVGRFWTANKSASAELTGVVFEAMPGNASGESGGDAGLWQVRVPTSLVATGVGLSIIQVTLETSEPRFLVGAERSPYANGAELVVTVDRPSLPTSANAREVVSSGVVAGYNPLLRFNNTMDTITCKLRAGLCCTACEDGTYASDCGFENGPGTCDKAHTLLSTSNALSDAVSPVQNQLAGYPSRALLLVGHRREYRGGTKHCATASPQDCFPTKHWADFLLAEEALKRPPTAIVPSTQRPSVIEDDSASEGYMHVAEESRRPSVAAPTATLLSTFGFEMTTFAVLPDESSDVADAHKSGAKRKSSQYLDVSEDLLHGLSTHPGVVLRVCCLNDDVEGIEKVLEDFQDAAACLLRNGASVDQASTKFHNTALHFAALRRLFQKSLPATDACDSQGCVALHHAARGGFLPVVVLLVEAACTIDVKNNEEQAPIDAAEEDSLEVKEAAPEIAEYETVTARDDDLYDQVQTTPRSSRVFSSPLGMHTVRIPLDYENPQDALAGETLMAAESDDASERDESHYVTSAEVRARKASHASQVSAFEVPRAVEEPLYDNDELEAYAEYAEEAQIEFMDVSEADDEGSVVLPTAMENPVYDNDDVNPAALLAMLEQHRDESDFGEDDDLEVARALNEIADDAVGMFEHLNALSREQTTRHNVNEAARIGRLNIPELRESEQARHLRDVGRLQVPSAFANL